MIRHVHRLRVKTVVRESNKFGATIAIYHEPKVRFSVSVVELGVAADSMFSERRHFMLEE